MANTKSVLTQASTGFALLILGQPALGGLLLTEIHYNGASPGLDPDEFVELTNTLPQATVLDDFRFTQGIAFTFPDNTILASQSSLVIARNTPGFLGSFPDFAGALFDYGGSLSNSGETLTLQSASAETVWSLTYDDSGAWPRSPDGTGDSLQLLSVAVDPTLGDSWTGAAPTPGRWSDIYNRGTQTDNPIDVPLPLPGTASLAGLGMLALHGLGRRRIAKQSGRSQS